MMKKSRIPSSIHWIWAKPGKGYIFLFLFLYLFLNDVPRNSYEIGVRLRARGLINLPDSTSQKFLLLGQVSKTDPQYGNDRAVIVFLDFSKTRVRQCQDSDYEKWYARPHDSECLMGHRVCVFFYPLPWGEEKDIRLFDYSYYSNGTNAENQMLTVTLARNTMTLLRMRTIANAQLRITSGTLSCFDFPFNSRFR
jgi:hypothetical protein